jgi:type IV pilus assembly protein PilW
MTRTRKRHNAGFTLVELMIAMAIGLIAMIGIVSLFGGTSRTNKLQEGLARLQENGRFAVMRVESDLRMASAQYCSTSTGNRHVGPVAPMWQDRAPFVFAANLNLPDSGGMRSVNTATGARSTTDATLNYGLSSRFFLQGFTCSTGTACTPALWNTGMFPSAGLAAGRRVPNSDVLTMRYLRGSGWPIAGAGNCVSGGSITLAPQAGDDPVNFPAATPSLALLSDCGSPSIVPVTSAAGNTLTLGTILPPMPTGGLPSCSAQGERDVRVFNFSTDFVTVTYYLAFRANDDPDARPNAPGNLSLVPTLIRRENGVEQELVRGVDRLDMRYGVRDLGGNLRFLTAAQVDNRLGGSIACPPKPDGVAPNISNPLSVEPGCLWRSVRRIEMHLLVNSGDEVPVLDGIGRSYRYMDVQHTPSETTPLPSGLFANSFPRREFIAHATTRNKNP